jgi:DNA-binding beta-propeller fold protein YncE
MPLLVTSACGANGAGFGKLLAFDRSGTPMGAFCDDPRIYDPRGLVAHPDGGLVYLNSGRDRILALDAGGAIARDTGPIEGLNPGGGNFGPDGRYYVGLRSARTVAAFASALKTPGQDFLDREVVPFPRGFAFGFDGRLFLGSGIGPTGEGDNAIVAFLPNIKRQSSRFASDPELSPLDLAIAPNGNIVASSEFPFGHPNAVTTVREYDVTDGSLVRIFRPAGMAKMRKPRGIRFGPDGNLYCVAQNEVIAFHFGNGECLGVIVQYPGLHGQALAFFP